MEEMTSEIVLPTDPKLLEAVKEELRKQKFRDSLKTNLDPRDYIKIKSSRKIIIVLLDILLTNGKIIIDRDQKEIYKSMKEHYSDNAFEGAIIQIERLCKYGVMRPKIN